MDISNRPLREFGSPNINSAFPKETRAIDTHTHPTSLTLDVADWLVYSITKAVQYYRRKKKRVLDVT